MSDPKTPPNEGESFFRKVVRFVANPTTDWADLAKGELETRESEYAKSELKAMIERKRRNDFVRKREFDMLRKIRREGLTSEGLSVLAGLSNLDDSEARQADNNARTDGVKAKIDEIEQQMVGESASFAARRTAPAPLAPAAAPAMTESFFNAPTVPLSLMSEAEARAARPPASKRPPTLNPAAPVPAPAARAPAPAAARGPAPTGAAAAALPVVNSIANLSNPFAVEVNELAHDPELDEAVIAFANADFEQCERTIRGLISPGGARLQHAETWLVLFDLYRAIGQQQSFESLALDYVHQFGWSPPQWFSLPKLVADAAAAASSDRKAGGSSGAGAARVDSAVSWVSPDSMDADGVAHLRSQLLQMPMPWVLDWSAIKHIDPEACHDLRGLLQSWAKEQLDMRWLAGEHLLGLLAESAPAGARDVDPEYWLLRLEACRLANRPDQFDEVAIDYCMTYEVSPPSWEAARCTVRMGSSTGATAAQLSHVSEVSTGFVESEIDEEGGQQVVAAELSGQLVGDISTLLKSLEVRLGTASIVNVSCAKLIRIDFIAAGDLLNWVLARRSENRAVNFDDTNRLVALFCGAMGINEHARVKVRNI
jgi:hypothetical protein